MRSIIFAVLLVLSLGASACDQWSVTATDRAYHADRSHDYNEHNKYVAVHCDEWLVGTLENSIRRRSFLIANQVRTPYTENLSLGYSLTVISGYSTPNYPHVFPFAGMTYTLGSFGNLGRHIAVDVNTNYVLTVVSLRYIVNPEVPVHRDYDPNPREWSLGYSRGIRGSRFDGFYNLSYDHPNLPRGLALGGSVEFGRTTRRDWISGAMIIRDRKGTNHGESLTLAWYPYGNKWIGGYAGVNHENIRYVSEYQASSVATDYAKAHNQSTFTIDGQKIPLSAHITESIDWKNRFAPTLGVRIGNPFGGTHRLTGYLDIGASHIGTPTRTVSSSILGVNPTGEDFNAKMNKYRWAPTLQIGVNYKF